MPSASLRLSLKFRPWLAVLALVFVVGARAQTPPPSKDLSEAVSTQLPNLRTLTEGKSFTEALRIIDGLLPGAAPDSYDVTLLTQIKAQILLTQSQYAPAATAIEQVIAQGQRLGYLDAKAILDHLYLLSQIYYQQAGEAKDDASRSAYFDRAYATLQRWFERAPQPTAEARLFAADLLYNSAVIRPDHIDRDKIERSLVEAERSLRLQVKANPRAYVLVLAARQQLGQREQAAEVLELLVTLQPQNTVYWQQLASSYLALASSAADPATAQRHTLHAILAVERAQALGLLRNPRENLNLVSLYSNLQRYDRATALLEQGLRDGVIENTRRNWEFLASAYQQSHEPARAVAALEKAVKTFPKDGQLEFALAQVFYGEGRTSDALVHLEKAVDKGGLEKPGQAHLFLGYVAFELQHYADAIRWSDAGTRFEDAKKDDLTRLNHAAKIALQERENRKEAKL